MMSQQWLDDWFPVVGLVLQVIFWAEFLGFYGSPELHSIVTFQRLPGDPNF